MKSSVLAVFISIISIICLGLGQPLQSMPLERGDYVTKPLIEVQYNGLELQIETGFSDRMIRGTARYSLSPKHAYVDSICWLAPGMDILTLEINGREASFRVDGDSLVVPFEVRPDPSQSYTVTVSYETRPAFGVHFKHNGTIFSSTLPGSVAHWLPGPIHPRVLMPVTVKLETPPDYNAFATGSPDNQETTDRGLRHVFRTEQDIPISELFFAAGDLSMEESFSGTKNLRVYYEKGVLEEGRPREILSNMVRRMRDYERYFRSELPFPTFHALILSDNKWETRPYAAGTAVLTTQSGQLETVLSRALAAQWLGISSRAERWADSRHITLLQALVADEMDDPDWQSISKPLEEAFRVPSTIYSEQDMESWQWSRHYLRERASPVIRDVLPSLMQTVTGSSGVYDPDDFSRMVYDKTGVWTYLSGFSEPEPESRLGYRVEISETRGSDQIRLAFIPIEDHLERDLNVNIHWIRDGEIYERQAVFRGTGDNLYFSAGGHASNVWIESADDSDIRFETDKPFSFWLYQLRRDDRPQMRRHAALALKDHASDPDLQLAVQDRISREQNADVLEALYRLMAELTAGASGTERRFLDGITSNDPEIRLVSMQSLQAYHGNQQVENRVLSVIQESDDMPLVNEAIRTYRHLINEDEFRDFAIRFLREDRQDQLFTKTLLEELFSVPVDESSVEAATEYMNRGYAFDIRWLAYRQLGRHAAGREWQTDFVKKFSDDPDPRIRFAALFSVSQLSLEDQGPFLESRMLLEYDIRILKQANRLAGSD